MADTLSSGKSQTSNNISPNVVFPQLQPSYGVVFEVITDIGSDSAKSKGLGSAIPIGGIRFRLLSDKNVNVNTNEQLSIAYPLNKNIVSLPTKNETVVIHNLGGVYHYSRMGGDLTPNVNTRENLISTTFVSDGVDFGDSKGKASDYQKVSDTGITRKQKSSNNSDYDGYGEYFTSDNTIHKLKLYEGDTLLESRFGQSIRFSGYNNSERVFSPTITIRNGENPESLTKPISNSTEEDINTDGSIILLGSGEKKLNFTLPTTIEYESFYDYPSELKGNQILLNSDRIILSAKTEDMIIVGKKNIGMITDGKLSLDARGGINITSEDNLFIDTKNKTLNINIGNGKINLGTDGELDYALKGNVLLDILREFMEIVGQQIFVTPAGATSPGPTNNARLNTLIGKLNDSLSKNIQLK